MPFSQIDTVETLGLLAGLLTTIAFIPQLVKTWKSKSADDVSLLMFLLFMSGVLIWCIYGWKIHAIPVVIANVITFLLSACILTLKLIFDFQSKKA